MTEKYAKFQRYSQRVLFDVFHQNRHLSGHFLNDLAGLMLKKNSRRIVGLPAHMGINEFIRSYRCPACGSRLDLLGAEASVDDTVTQHVAPEHRLKTT
jgi:hypothetical protein